MNTASRRHSIVAALCMLLCSSARAADRPPAALTVDWKDRAAKGLVRNGEAIDLTEERSFAAAHALKVVGHAREAVDQTHNPVILVTTIESPPITKQYFALNGWIRCKGIEGTGYLEMWTQFADGSHYFSRTLEVAGPLESLSGDSEWRKISIPFQLSDDPKAAKPNKLILNVVLPGSGEVTFSDLTLAEGDSFAAAISADTGLLTIDWKVAEISNGDAIDLTEERPFAATHAVKVVSSAKPGETVISSPVIRLTTIENPPITKQNFSLNGWIRHKGMAETGFLEMWVIFADGSHYFSRTLADAGPMQSLKGDSDWREISLPFQLSADPKAAKPNKLLVNLVLPGAGEVTLSDLTLTEGDNVTAAMMPGAWWSDRSAGLVGGIGGSLIGLLGAIVGVLAGMGIGRPLVITILAGVVAIACVLVPAGIVALAIGQPYAVYYPLLFGGGMCGMFGTIGFAVLRQRYAAVEMRRMQALDA